MNEREMAERNLIFKAISGSYLYGTNTENSDKDYVGIFIPEKDYVLGMKKCEIVEVKTNPADSGHRNTKDDVDITYYSLSQFIHLAFQNNPNIIELFFVNEKNLLYCNDFGRRLMRSYTSFVSKRCKDRFLGYAISQKHKVLNKNPIGDRKKYIEQFGYDVKFASHLIRLLSEGLRILERGCLEFPLYNASVLADIKQGKYSLDHLLELSNQYEQDIKAFYEDSKLPSHGDFEAVNELQIELLEDFWRSRK